MPQAKILIIGGGASGLTTAGALKHYGLDATILDKESQIGDVWRERYSRLHLHTIRGLSYLAYHKMPEAFPRYVPKDKFADYLQAYADHFQLDIRHGCVVTQIQQADDGQWRVKVENGDDWYASHLIIATGLNRVPLMPTWPEQSLYKGKLIHAVDYKTGVNFKNQRVLVVGSGNTGTEICADLVEQGAQEVHISIRTPPLVVPRDPFGIPIHVWGVPMSLLPAGVGDRLASLVARLRLGDLTRYGMKHAQWSIFKDKRIPTIDVGFVKFLKEGKITVQPEIGSFTADGVIFKDGAKQSYDAVITATGYRSGLQNIISLPDVVDSSGNLLVACGEPIRYRGLWFVGLVNSPAGILMAARIQSRKVANHIAQEMGIEIKS